MRPHLQRAHPIVLAALLAAAACGCANTDPLTQLQLAPPPEQVCMSAPPKIETEQDVAGDPTLLEKYRTACKMAEEQKASAEKLVKELAAEKDAAAAAQRQLDDLKRKTASLEAKNAQLENLANQYAEAQQQLLELANTVRDLRRSLLQERLTRVKLEQTVLTLKIDVAKARRRKLLQNNVSYKLPARSGEKTQ